MFLTSMIPRNVTIEVHGLGVALRCEEEISHKSAKGTQKSFFVPFVPFCG